MRTEGCVLAFDFGLKHIGVAAGQTVTGTAGSLTTIHAKNGTPDWRIVKDLVTEWRPFCLLVGLPLNMDDSESGMSERARAFAASLQTHTGIDVHLVDERLTSRAARELDPNDSHGVSATLIAESWLGQRR